MHDMIPGVEVNHMQLSELLAKYGSQSAIARRFGITPTNVSRWAKTGVVPERYALRELAGEVVQELESGEQSASTRRLIRKVKAGLRPAPDA
jgi:transcriptional regulator with XRE-family HTH domain